MPLMECAQLSVCGDYQWLLTHTSIGLLFRSLSSCVIRRERFGEGQLNYYLLDATDAMSMTAS